MLILQILEDLLELVLLMRLLVIIRMVYFIQILLLLWQVLQPTLVDQ